MWKSILFAVLMAGVSGAGEIAGAAMHRSSVITWGGEIREWRLDTLRSITLVRSGGPRGEGGCIVDAERAGWGLVVQEGVPFGDLVIRRAPHWIPEKIDTGVQMHDCLATRMGGEAGVLVLHRFAQVRFYVPPVNHGERWSYREIYSIYTPSRQGGLLMAPFGLVVGNYWMQAPPEPDAPWREFAINTWSETTDSATMRFAWMGEDLIVTQGHMAEARLARFSATANRTQIWNEQRLAENLKLRYPHALAGDGERFVVGENAGPGSRLFLFDASASSPILLGTTTGTHTAFLFQNFAITIGTRDVLRWDLSPEGRRRRLESNPRGGARRGR